MCTHTVVLFRPTKYGSGKQLNVVFLSSVTMVKQENFKHVTKNKYLNSKITLLRRPLWDGGGGWVHVSLQ